MTRKYRSQAYAEIGEFDKAIVDMTEVRRLMPDKQQPTDTLADLFALRSHFRASNQLFSQAADDMTEAIRLKPTSENYRRRASCFFHDEQYELALDDLNEAIQQEPQNSEYYQCRADCNEKLGRNDDRDRDLKKAEELKSQ